MRVECRDNHRHYQGRARVIRARTVSPRELARFKEPAPRIRRPETRADCGRVPRPCPFVGCRYNLYLDVSERGGIKLNFPDLEPEEIDPDCSCALDVVKWGPQTLEAVAALMNLTRERVRQIESICMERLHEQLLSSLPEDILLLVPIEALTGFFCEVDNPW